MNTLHKIAADLVAALQPLRFGAPIAFVYNPLEYARLSHRRYLELGGRGQKEIVLVGMNPGPFGMAQTGVPFGDPVLVRDWLGIDAPVGKPVNEHPKRPVLGFASLRREVSGMRLWGWARDRFETPDRFFGRFYVANYCPLCFMEDSGRNRTPDKLPKEERERLFAACDEALRTTVDVLQPQYVIGVGRFAAERAHEALDPHAVRIGCVPHPSPANPAANQGWPSLMDKALADLGIKL